MGGSAGTTSSGRGRAGSWRGRALPRPWSSRPSAPQEPPDYQGDEDDDQGDNDHPEPSRPVIVAVDPGPEQHIQDGLEQMLHAAILASRPAPFHAAADVGPARGGETGPACSQ